MKYLFLIFCLISTITAYANEDFYGVYEQEPLFDEDMLKRLSPEQAEQAMERFEEGKLTLEITPEVLHIKVPGFADKPDSIPYQIQGDFLLAPVGNTYYVLYLKEPNHIFSSGMKFSRGLESSVSTRSAVTSAE